MPAVASVGGLLGFSAWSSLARTSLSRPWARFGQGLADLPLTHRLVKIEAAGFQSPGQP